MVGGITISAAYEFWHVVDSLYGAYLDATQGFELVLKRFNTSHDRLDAEHLREHPDILLPSREDSAILYGRSDEVGSRQYSHFCPAPRYVRRNSPGGDNFVFLARMFIVTVFQFWEGEFRDKIATELGITSDTLRVRVIGDLRLLRNMILHNAGRADQRALRLELLRYWQPGDNISPDADQIDEIVRHVLEFVHGAGSLRASSALAV